MIDEEQRKLWEESAEREKAKAYGPPEIRQQKRSAYVAKLVHNHSEILIRQILTALSKLDNFIPARGLSKVDLESVPLEDVLRAYDIPWFYFEKIENRDSYVYVDVSHGIDLAAEGETFVFQIQGNEARLIERYSRWIS